MGKEKAKDKTKDKATAKAKTKAIVKCKIATYAEDEYVVEVPCEKDDIDELIISRAWKIVKEQEEALPYGGRSAEIIKRTDAD